MKPQVKDPLDKLFTPLSEAQPEAPSAAFLQDVENRLDALQKKRRKPLAIWWVWSAFGAVLISGLLFYSNANNQVVAGNKAQQKPQRIKVFLEEDNIKKTTHINNSSSSKNVTNSLRLPKPLMPNGSSSTITSNQSKSQRFSFPSSEFSLISESYSITAADPHFSAPKREELSVIEENNTKTPSMKEEMSGLNLSNSDTTHLVKTQLGPAVPNIPSQSLQLPSGRLAKHSFGLQFGVSAIFSSFEVDSGVNAFIPPYTYKELREWRELGERQTSSWDLSLRYQYTFGKWGLQTGLSYLEWGEQYTYKVISVEGTNRYQYIQVPLGLCYQIPLRKIVLQPAVGLGLGYGVKRAGAYILPNNNGVAVVASKKWAANAYAQLELVYQVNSQLKFSVSPMFRYTLGKIVDNHVIMNKYQSLGLLTGFMYSF